MKGRPSHWNAIATLIKSKLEAGKYDMYEIRDTLGRENIQTSTNYLMNTKQYMKLAPYDWFKHILRFNKFSTNYIKEENTLKSILLPKTTLSTGDSSRRSESSEQKQTVFK